MTKTSCSGSDDSKIRNRKAVASASTWEAPLPSFSTSKTMEKEEKTIPFLRQLTDILQNNEELISFVPGQRRPNNNNETICGKIIVHNRQRVEKEILPIYFNHAPFASLRRQLSYFSFVRVGKSRAVDVVVYTNDNVIELSDILKLKRRAVGRKAAVHHQQQQLTAAVVRKANEARRQHQGKILPTQSNKHILRQASAEQEQMSTNFAAAVHSGILNATNTNVDNDMDTKRRVTTRRGSYTADQHGPTSQSHIESSLSQGTSSSSSSDSCTSNSNNSVSSTNFKKKHKIRKKHHHKKKHSKPSPNKASRKDKKRLNKLLSKNKIVPFIFTGQQNNNDPMALPKRTIPNRMEALPSKLPPEIGVSSSKCNCDKPSTSSDLTSSKGTGGQSSSKSTTCSPPSDEQARAIKFKFHKTTSSKAAAAAAGREAVDTERKECHVCEERECYRCTVGIGWTNINGISPADTLRDLPHTSIE